MHTANPFKIKVAACAVPARRRTGRGPVPPGDFPREIRHGSPVVTAPYKPHPPSETTMTHQQRDYDCPLSGARVILSQQVFRLSGLGNPRGSLQREFGCSAEEVCTQRHDPNCPRRQLQDKADRLSHCE